MSAPAHAAGGATTLAPGPLASVLLSVAAAARTLGAPVFLVGGAVRDLLLARRVVDVDLAVAGAPDRTLALAEALARELGGEVKARHERFGTATVSADGLRLDLATTRREEYPEPGALPVITGGAPIEEDLARRDFTVHAMAAPLLDGGALGAVLDPFGGRADLTGRRLRLLHARSLADDPTRALRAARYAARLGFAWDDGFGPALEESRRAGSWTRISGERLRRSFEEVLADENGAEAFALLRAAGVLDDVVPGWGAAGAPRLDAPLPPEPGWTAIAAPLAPGVRSALAERLRFSRALRRAAGVPR